MIAATGKTLSRWLSRFALAGVLAAGVLGVLLHCAHVERPPGGPEDKTPPVLVGVFPSPGSINQPRELKVVLEFSEWMSRDGSQHQIFISPALPQKLRYHYEGTQLRITSGSRLQPNTTYILTVSPTITDLRKNRLGRDFQLIFSTGAVLDSGRVSGKIHAGGEGSRLLGLYPLGPRRDSLIHLKRLLKSQADSTSPRDAGTETARSPSASKSIADSLPNPWLERPMYVIPADSTGAFSFRGIREGEYAVLSFVDVNGNLKPEIGAEAVGIGEARLTVGRETPEISLLPAPFDTAGLRVEQVSWAGEWLYQRDGQRVANGNVRLKGSVISEIFPRLSPEHFRLVRSDSLDTLSFSNISYHPDSQAVELWPEPLSPDSVYTLYGTADTAEGQARWSQLGYVRADTTADTLPVAILPASFASGDSGVLVDSGLVFYHSKFLTDKRLESLKEELRVRLEDSTHSFEVFKLDHHRFRLRFSLPNYRGQSLKIERKNPQAQRSGGDLKADSLKATEDPVDSLRHSGDTSKVPEESYGILARVQLANDKQWGKARIYPTQQRGTWHYTLSPLSPKMRGRTVVSSQRPVLVDSLAAGDYRLKFFLDSNENGYWDRGGFHPWEEQEPFVELTDTVTIAPGAVYTYP